MDTTEPSYTTTNNSGEVQGSALYVYGLGFFFGFFILIIIFYLSYICKRHMCSSTTTTAAANENHLITAFSSGLDDNILLKFPTFVFSEFTDAIGSGCYICLADYKPVDVIRLLPECGHLFHVRCIDTWLKAHPTCPVCRKSLLDDIVPL